MGMRPLVILRGGGDLATGIAARLHRSGFAILVLEVAQPLAIRRLVALAEAVYEGETQVEDLHGRRVESTAQAWGVLENGGIPVRVDPEANSLRETPAAALVDARMTKRPPELPAQNVPHGKPRNEPGPTAGPAVEREAEQLVIGLGPGFTAGLDCHAVVETQRGHWLGRVIWNGAALADSGVPEPVAGYSVDRVLRAPVAGVLKGVRALGSIVEPGETIAEVDGQALRAPFRGALRGLLHDGLDVHPGMKVGDLDPRCEPIYCSRISDKALAVGGGVLEALLSRPEIRRRLSE